ncbi:hypothetical protein Dsin_003187 [Dipteronia sinensis]|uniref:RNase H type-1 domain-containing protein n=1 Tax=Dipteronia sinensis TaxID=43782 RepID=A0AAE0EK47_9ROSI|nr:hypothetical protein Dsin_003187 [Dipteronia sinensis]
MSSRITPQIESLRFLQLKRPHTNVQYWTRETGKNNSFLACGCRAKASTQRIVARVSPQVAEALALLRGIQFVVDSGLMPAIVESDAKVVVDMIKLGAAPMADIGVIISDILSSD